MKKTLPFSLFFLTFFVFSQSNPDWKRNELVFTPEIRLGKTMEANDGFPKTKLQKQLVFNLGRSHVMNPQQWAQQLKKPITGFSLALTDFGNLDSLGVAITAMPYIEFRAFGSNRWKMLTGIGASYFTEKYHPETNPNNKAVTTDITWAFELFLNYLILDAEKVDWRVGLGYSHHSNGHTRLLNQGYNSFLLSLSAAIKNPLYKSEIPNAQTYTPHNKTVYDYVAVRGGLGQNVLALAFNDKKNVYTLAGEYGRVYNNTFKVGIGFYYRFYQQYYDYIKGNESLVQAGREFDYFKSNPWHYATNLGVSIHGELFLNHIGIDLQLGYNFHKPAYKLDWRINEGWDNTPREIDRSWVLGELNGKYKMKYRISSRLGLKYYLIGMEKSPRNNLYVGANLNANLGQADFTEVSLGYVYSFNFRTRN